MSVSFARFGATTFLVIALLLAADIAQPGADIFQAIGLGLCAAAAVSLTIEAARRAAREETEAAIAKALGLSGSLK